MPEYEFSTPELTSDEVSEIDHAIKRYSRRFTIDEREDAIADGWCAVLTFDYDSPKYPRHAPRDKQLEYLKGVGCNAACRFVDRFAYDAPLGKNGNAQTHRMTDQIPE